MATKQKIPALLYTTSKPVKVLYPNIFEPSLKYKKEDEYEYSVVLLIPKSDTNLVLEIKNKIKEAAKHLFGDKNPATFNDPLRDGDEEVETEEGPKKYAERAGHFYLRVHTDAVSGRPKPGIVDAKKQVVTDQELIYSGCFCKVNMNIKAYRASALNCGVTCYLNHVQFIKDGPAIFGVRAEDAFSVEETEEDNGFDWS